MIVKNDNDDDLENKRQAVNRKIKCKIADAAS
jgi:hypothetical protein